MAHTPPEAHTVFQGIACPECGLPENHIQDVYTGTGLNAFGRSDERTGTKTLLACESGHAWILGIGEHKGASFIYVRLPLGGEVDEVRDYYDPNANTLSAFRFSGRPEPVDWHPRARPAEGSPWPRASLSDIDSGVFA